MSVVDHGIAAEVEKSIIEVGEGFLEVTEQEIRDALLEIRNGKVLIEANGALVAFHLFADVLVLYCLVVEPLDDGVRGGNGPRGCDNLQLSHARRE